LKSAVIGIGAVISKSILLFNALKWLGAAYLIYIGIKSLTTKRVVASTKTAEPKRQIQPWAAFRIGLLGNLLNPKATLFFLALFTQIVRPSTPILIQAAYGMTVVVLALTWFSIGAVVISQQAFKNRILSFSHWLERLTGAALIALGFRLAVAEASE
jgi:threonine/homoserine/homoserine lactone efflux protein